MLRFVDYSRGKRTCVLLTVVTVAFLVVYVSRHTQWIDTTDLQNRVSSITNNIIPGQFQSNESTYSFPYQVAPDPTLNGGQTAQQYGVQDLEVQDSEEPTLDMTFAERGEKVRSVCATGTVQGQVKGIFTHKPSGVMYCYIPKAGCTFWKTIFESLNANVPITPENFFKYSKLQVHDVAGAYGQPFSIIEAQSYPTRFTVVRDPYSRLLSSYLDKAYLPEFWPSHVKTLNLNIKSDQRNDNDFLRRHFDQMAETFYPLIFKVGLTTTFKDYRCARWMTFAEFVSTLRYHAEPHWQPIYELCNPCMFNATHISKMDTFIADAKSILPKMGIDHLLDNFSHQKQVDLELQVAVSYSFQRTFNYTNNEFFKNCITPAEVCQRLWNTFQWKGYIHPTIMYQRPQEELTVLAVAEDCLRQVQVAREKGLEEPELMKEAKINFLTLAYKSLSPGSLDWVDSRFALDIQLFGFEKERDRIMDLIQEDKRVVV